MKISCKILYFLMLKLIKEKKNITEIKAIINNILNKLKKIPNNELIFLWLQKYFLHFNINKDNLNIEDKNLIKIVFNEKIKNNEIWNIDFIKNQNLKETINEIFIINHLKNMCQKNPLLLDMLIDYKNHLKLILLLKKKYIFLFIEFINYVN